MKYFATFDPLWWSRHTKAMLAVSAFRSQGYQSFGLRHATAKGRPDQERPH